MLKRIASFLIALLLAFSFAACAAAPQNQIPHDEQLPDLTLLPDAPEDAAAPSPETDVADAQAPPAADENTAAPSENAAETAPQAPSAVLPEDGVYDSKEDVALYLHLYGHLPNTFITKKEAQALGWTGGSLEPYAPGMCIDGARFGNYEDLLPKAKGRQYTECDIDTLGARSRGAKRIVFSNDGLIYYTGDHYASFELLYGEE